MDQRTVEDILREAQNLPRDLNDMYAHIFLFRHVDQ
jgi:hypothetical protein